MFRGFDPCSGKWRYGTLIIDKIGMSIIKVNDCAYQRVESKTVGEFTSLKDKHKKDIFEGDILKYTQHKGYLLESCEMTVVFDNENGCFGYIKSTDENKLIHPFSEHDDLKNDVLDYVEIIGNIYNK